MDLTAYTLGETDQLLKIDNKEDFAALILAMSQQALNKILIFSHHLDTTLFDNVLLYDAIKQLAIRNRRTHIQILLQDAKPMTKKGHRLLNLARRISSHVSIKLAHKEQQELFETFIIFDDRAYILHTNPERYDAQGNFYAPLKTRQLAEQFEAYWEQGTIDNSLRRLSL
jgi:hypothetical protein